MVVGSSAPAEAAAVTAQQVKASTLKAGDVVVGPEGRIVRVARTRPTSGGRYLLDFLHPVTGALTPFDGALALVGLPANRTFLRLARGVSAGALAFPVPEVTPIDTVREPVEIDGGTP